MKKRTVTVTAQTLLCLRFSCLAHASGTPEWGVTLTVPGLFTLLLENSLCIIHVLCYLINKEVGIHC